MASRVLSLRIDAELWDRIRDHAARRGMSAQDYVVRTLVRDDFDQRFQAAVVETDRFYAVQPATAPATRPTPGPASATRPTPSIAAGTRTAPGAAAAREHAAGPSAPAQTRPSAGIR